jgi:DNA-binding MarR family transcriptional regulator
MPKTAKDAEPAEAIAAECIAVRLRALNRAVTSLYDEALRPHGLRVSQLNLLVAVTRMGTARPGDLCRLLRMDKSTLSRDAELLRHHGWLDVDEGRGRARPLRITSAGQELIKTVVPAWRQAQRKARKLLGDDGANAVLQMACRLRSDEGVGL